VTNWVNKVAFFVSNTQPEMGPDTLFAFFTPD
jgi:hypothetical protein